MLFVFTTERTMTYISHFDGIYHQLCFLPCGRVFQAYTQEQRILSGRKNILCLLYTTCICYMERPYMNHVIILFHHIATFAESK